MSKGITERIYAKSDAELRKKLEESIKWVWEQTGHGATVMPDDKAGFLKAMDGTELNNLKGIPWIGAAQRLHTETAFLYLRDKYRSKAVFDFMAKVETLSAEVQEIRDMIPNE